MVNKAEIGVDGNLCKCMISVCKISFLSPAYMTESPCGDVGDVTQTHRIGSHDGYGFDESCQLRFGCCDELSLQLLESCAVDPLAFSLQALDLMISTKDSVCQCTKAIIAQLVSLLSEMLAHRGILEEDAVNIDPAVGIKKVGEGDVVDEWVQA